MTLVRMFPRRRIPSRSWSRYLREKTLKKQWQNLNICCRTMATMTTTTRMMKKKATREKTKMKRTTPLSNSEKEKMYYNADEIKTAGNEAPIPTGRRRDLLNRIDITTPLEFRIKRVRRSMDLM
jgi:hypothetical protein